MKTITRRQFLATTTVTAGARCVKLRYPMMGWMPMAVAKPAMPARHSTCQRLRLGVPHQTQKKTVMPVQHIGFKLVPIGFFDRNPALDVPAPVSKHAACAHHGNGAGG